ncbi:DUF4238 domain-containing protein [uncultured Tateyamaria sp.]|uniref:DUF4238 domain-containing protein n=1 Tax=uncultured Tateyamaria sp. TaxID=455651 RepID=UPI00263A115C|nr:DUF4238 domain-containing protein [uncultured Tateyamaria sp.]
MSQLSKWHHYVPEGVLKRFCYAEPKLWYFSKARPSEGICSRDIGKKFRRRHYYSTEDSTGKKSDVLEREFLQVLDSRFADFIDDFHRICSMGVMPKISLETRKFLQQFIYYYTKRNPDFERTLGMSANPRVHVESAIANFEAAFGTVQTEQKQRMLTDEAIQSTYNYARVQSLARESATVNARLEKMSLHFAFSSGKSSFIVGSNPVVRLENKEGAVLGDGNVEIWTPLTPKVMMGFAGPNSPFDECIKIPMAEVRKVNLQTIKQSTEVGSHSRQLISSLLSAR